MGEIKRRRFAGRLARLAGALAVVGAASLIGIGAEEERGEALQEGVIERYTPVYDHRRMNLYPREGAFSHSEPAWKELREGLHFARVIAYRSGVPVDSMGVVRADPEHCSFRVFHDKETQGTIEQWQRRTGAEVAFNSSYYQVSRDPVGLIITDGTMKGPKVNSAMRGMFVAEPVDERKPIARIIDFSEEAFDYKNPAWRTGVQSFPMLLDRQERVRVRNSDWYANRTVLCDGDDGNVYVFTTEGGYFSLHDFGRFLRESRFGIRSALNMDGGYEAEMIVRTQKLGYLTYGQWETQGEADISVPGIRIRIPAVVGIFPRK